LAPKSKKKLCFPISAKEAGFLLFMNDDEGKAIPDEPNDDMEPKSLSYKLPKPKIE
jgi:hypothetical protein